MLSKEDKHIIASLFHTRDYFADFRSQILALSLLLSRIEIAVAGNGKFDKQLAADMPGSTSHSRNLSSASHARNLSSASHSRNLSSASHSRNLSAASRTRSISSVSRARSMSSASRSRSMSFTGDDETQIRRHVATDILESLAFSSVRERLEDIDEAHLKTFEWIFDPSLTLIAGQPNLRLDSFPIWLREQSGLYWVNGRAASGKSTLMKFILGHSETRRLLKEWSSESPLKGTLCMASFFFWGSGTEEQRSQRGLLRAVLHELLLQKSDLIPLAFPREWSVLYTRRLGFQFASDEAALRYTPFDISESVNKVRGDIAMPFAGGDIYEQKRELISNSEIRLATRQPQNSDCGHRISRSHACECLSLYRRVR